MIITDVAALRAERDDLERAFQALWLFANTEMHWEFFRSESSGNESASHRNAAKLEEFLEKLKHVPAVAQAIQKAREGAR